MHFRCQHVGVCSSKCDRRRRLLRGVYLYNYVIWCVCVYYLSCAAIIACTRSSCRWRCFRLRGAVVKAIMFLIKPTRSGWMKPPVFKTKQKIEPQLCRASCALCVSSHPRRIRQCCTRTHTHTCCFQLLACVLWLCVYGIHRVSSQFSH